jgi:hypothetical protein
LECDGDRSPTAPAGRRGDFYLEITQVGSQRFDEAFHLHTYLLLRFFGNLGPRPIGRPKKFGGFEEWRTLPAAIGICVLLSLSRGLKPLGELHPASSTTTVKSREGTDHVIGERATGMPAYRRRLKSEVTHISAQALDQPATRAWRATRPPAPLRWQK